MREHTHSHPCPAHHIHTHHHHHHQIVIILTWWCLWSNTVPCELEILASLSHRVTRRADAKVVCDVTLSLYHSTCCNSR